MKKGFKRRAWTTADVRTLKSLAQKKTPAGRIARKPEAHRKGDVTKGTQDRIVTPLTHIAATNLALLMLRFNAHYAVATREGT